MHCIFLSLNLHNRLYMQSRPKFSMKERYIYRCYVIVYLQPQTKDVLLDQKGLWPLLA